MQETARDTSVPLSSRAARLSGLRIGMWRSRKHETLWLIVAPKYSKFVFVVEQQDTKVETPRRGAFQRRSSMLRQLGAHSPFTASSVYTEKSRVFCFDVRYSDIRGVDYLNPLVRSGKLVLDAFHVSKREFADIDSAFKYYEVDTRLMDGSCPCQAHKDTHVVKKRLFDDLETIHAGNSPMSFEFLPQKHDSTIKHERKRSKPSSPGTCVSDLSMDAFFGESDTVEHMDEHNPEENGLKGEESGLKGEERGLKGEEDVAILAQNFTVTTCTYQFRSISAEWKDVHLPCALLPVFEKDERLLKMYESGLPTWAVFLPSYGFYYRPWLRTFSWMLFYIFSIFSLAVGFWDLYKTLPGLQSMLSRLVESLWLPPAAVLQWIEEHAQIRLSILLTYLFGKSEFLMFIMKNMGNAWRHLCTIFAPAMHMIAPVMVMLRQSVSEAWSGLSSACAPLLSILQLTYGFLSNILIQPIYILYSIVIAPVSLLSQSMKQLWNMSILLASGFAGVVKAIFGSGGMLSFMSLGSQTLSNSASRSAITANWVILSFPAEALRSSVVKVLRASNSVWKFIVHICTGISRHRLTLSRRAARAWMRFTRQLKHLLAIVAWKIIDFFLAMYEWLFAGARYTTRKKDGGKYQASEDTTAAVISGSYSHAATQSLHRRHHVPYDDTAESRLTPERVHPT